MKTATANKPSKTTDSKLNGGRRETPQADLTKSLSETSPPADKVKEGVKEIAEDAKAKVSDTAAAIAEAAREKIADTKTKMAELTETSRQTAEQKYDETIATVRRKPVSALGIAAGIGALVGFAVASMISGRRS